MHNEHDYLTFTYEITLIFLFTILHYTSSNVLLDLVWFGYIVYRLL